MIRSLTPRSLVAAAVALSASFAASLQPAHAQSFYNMPYYLGSSLVYPLGRVLFGSGSSIYNMSNPYYLTNRFVNGNINSSGIFRAPGYGQMPAGVNNSYVNQYGQYNQTNGYNQPDPNQLADPNALVPQQPAGQTGALGGFYSSQSTQYSAQPGQFSQATQSANATPPLAPQLVKQMQRQQIKQQMKQLKMQSKLAGKIAPNAVQNAAPAIVSPLATSSASAPLAQGFVSMVNTKYEGDISKALFSADGRSWARTVGLIDNNEIFGADLSAERVGVIGKIFKDPGLDASSKLDAAKILLRTSSPATPVAGSAK